MESKTLTITERGNTKSYTIDDPEKLGEAMIKYFEEHQAEILEKTRETNQKKSQSTCKKGWKHKRKPKT